MQAKLMGMDGESYAVRGDTHPNEGQTTGKRIVAPSSTTKPGRTGVTYELVLANLLKI